VLYGGWLPTTDIPMSQPTPTLDLTPGITGRLLYLVGEDDTLIPAGPRDQIRGALQDAGTDHDMVCYPGTGHARKLASEQSFDQDEVVRWLRDGDDEERVTALVMMQAQPELRDFEALLAAIKRPATPFEQFHALLLADMMVDDLPVGDKQRLAEAVRSVRTIRFRADGDRWRLSERILHQAGQ
jgi:pimeloyl-ACP methyl ester carboxylesterase